MARDTHEHPWSRRRILFNSDPEPTEALLALEASGLGLVYIFGTFAASICKAPSAVGLISTIGDDGLHLIGAILIAVAACQWGAVYHDLLWTRRVILIAEIGWWLFVCSSYGIVLGFAFGPILFAIFSAKAIWALARLFRPGVHDDSDYAVAE